MAILNLNLDRETSAEEMNEYLRGVSLNSPLQDQIDYTASTELVSSDMVGSAHAGVVDSEATIVDGDRLVLYIWYDNEYGYSTQVIRMMQEVAGLKFKTVPAE
jgi:glyceraldehyde 3-phosphate dehydrogenase